jgi:hypothetical protein
MFTDSIKQKNFMVTEENYRLMCITGGLYKRGLNQEVIKPLLSFPFIDWLESYDFSQYKIIEFGSGKSTHYFDTIFQKVVSFETDKEFYNNLKDELAENIEYNFIENKDLESGNYEIPIDEKTFVLIDNGCNRYYTAKNLLSKNKPNIIILDNSEWYSNTCKVIIENGYSEIPFWGIRYEEFNDKCTSLFIKNGYNLPSKNYNFFTVNAIKDSSRLDIKLEGGAL